MSRHLIFRFVQHAGRIRHGARSVVIPQPGAPAHVRHQQAVGLHGRHPPLRKAAGSVRVGTAAAQGTAPCRQGQALPRQQPYLPGEALKAALVAALDVLHGRVVEFVRQRAGGLHHDARVEAADIGGGLLQCAAGRRARPAGVPAPAAVSAAHVPHVLPGRQRGHIRRRPVGKAVFRRQRHQCFYHHNAS